MKNEITLDQARRVLEVVDAGLCLGLGEPKPGKMCVEAAVCYALGQPHGDEPQCVNLAVRKFKIRLNDNPWSSNKARAAGMRKLAIAQLGTSDPSFDEKKFVEVLVEQTIRKIVPYMLRSVIKWVEDQNQKAALEEAAVFCERDGDLAAVRGACSAADDIACATFTYAHAADPYADAAAAAAYATAYAATAAAADAATAATAAADASTRAATAAANAATRAAVYAAAVATAAATRAAAYAAAAAAAGVYAGGVGRNDIALNMSADIGVHALRAAGAHGIKLMDQLIPA